MMRRAAAGWRLFATAFLLFVLATPAALAASRPEWPQGRSDLAADPSVSFGTLSNGMRYAIQRNANPAGQVALRLMFTAGSMQEAHDQEGLAHFLEHMAFHGSAHVGDGEMALALQRLGMRLGADINAGTGRDLTVYKFNLTKSDEASVDSALNLFREIGSELTLDPVLMERERKVILAEGHSRTAAQQKLEMEQFAALFGDHPLARAPIGRDEVILGAPVQRMRDFYDAYYRPERAIVIVVGDIDPARIETMIKARFNDWRGRGTPGKDPGPVKSVVNEPTFKLAVIPGLELSSQTLRLFYVHPFKSFRDSRDQETERLTYIVAAQAAENRLIQLNERAGKPFTNGTILTPLGIPRRLADIDYSNASLISDWRATLTLLARAQHQLLEQGLTQYEVDGAVRLTRSAMAQWVAQYSNQSSPRIADELVGDVESGTVSRTPQQTLDLFDEAVAGLKVERANKVLRAHLGEPLVFLTTSQAPEGGEEAMRAVYEAAMKEQVVPFELSAATYWRYTDFGKQGVVAWRRNAPEATMVRFANGTRLTIRASDSAKGQVLVTVRFGHGQLDLPKDKIDASDFGAQILNMGGYRDLSQPEADRALAGEFVAAVASAGDDAFTLSGPTGVALRPDVFEKEMQVIAAKIAFPGWRTDDWPSLIASMARADDARDASPQAVYRIQGPMLTHPGDARWVVDTAAMRASWKPEGAVAFIKPILETAPLEVIVVGDIAVDRVIDAVGKTLGALPTRVDSKEPPGLRQVRFPAPTMQPVELHHNGPAYQALVVLDWPTTDALADTRQTQASRLLADIMQQRAFDQIRNQEGSAYAPSVTAQFSETLPGYGMISAAILVRPEDIARVFSDLDAIAADLAAHEATADEFSRAQSARIAQANRNQRNNAWWMHYLAGAQTDPRLLGFATREMSEISSVTAADVRAAAQRWLVKGKSWRLKITPNAAQ
jgi:zinc protease